MTDVAFQGPKRGADRAVLLAHGAGADMHAVTLTAFADALADAGIPSMRFNFAYRAKGKGAPPRTPVLEAELRAAVEQLAQHTGVPRERLVLGGRSMGGRVASMVTAADGALGLVLLGYPLHPPGKPEQLRTDHFPALTMPVLFVSGTRDTFGTPEELTRASAAIPGAVEHQWIDTADHGFRPLKRATGLTIEEACVRAAVQVAAWVGAL